LAMEKYSTAVIGGGAAGICAAISQARKGESVIICEKMPQLGKKILASGDGRCNLLNDDLSEVYYNPAARNLVRSILNQFDKLAILGFFKDLGLQVYSREGRIFPITNQANSVLKVLEMELERLRVRVELNFNCAGISFSPSGVSVSSSVNQNIQCQKVIITGGGKTYPAFGSDGSLYEIARQLGHSIIEPVPAVVPLLVKDSLCQILQGQRISARVKSIIDGCEGVEAAGDLLFTKYGLSGTCILDVSEAVSIAMNRHHKSEVFLSVDMVPFMGRESLKVELEKRKKEKRPAEGMMIGILPNKFGIPLRSLFDQNDINSAVDSLKYRRFKISGTKGWNEAEFTSGGVNVNEVNPLTLESRLRKGVYFAGEILDVNGQRGGYNLGWAWASGLVAGQTN
jgi:predicted Rossmann fold flavoprotein